MDERALSGDALAEAMFGPLSATVAVAPPKPLRRPKSNKADRAPRRSPRERNGVPPWAARTAKLVLVPALAWSIIWATNHYVAQTFLIPSASMATTLAVGDRVLVTQLTRGDIKRGEIVVFTDPDGWLTKAGTPEPAEELNVFASTMVKLGLVAAPRDDYLIKRVIGVAGDHIVADGTGPVIVNGHTLTEPYLDAGIVGSTLAFDVTVPEGFVWVMGDNRENSADSRYNQDDAHHGMVPLGDVFGTAVATLMPSEHMGMLTDEGKAIADLG